jgi:hypothetical protein
MRVGFRFSGSVAVFHVFSADIRLGLRFSSGVSGPACGRASHDAPLTYWSASQTRIGMMTYV